MRLAFFTPLNPVRSGISDYSEELLPFLGKRAEVDIVIGPYRPASESIVQQFRVIQAPEFLSRKSSYDGVIYQIGNNYPAHGYMMPCLAAVPGIVVLHDYSLTYLILPMTLQRGDLATLERILQPSHGARARSIALRLLAGLIDPYKVSLCRPVVEMSRAVIVHNHHAFGKLTSEFPQVRVQRIPHATPIRELPNDIAELRIAYGFQPDDIILASVSSLAYNKRTQLVLAALRRLRKDFPRLKFIMVGQGDLGGRAKALIRRFDLAGCLVQTGWVPSQAYLDYIDLADVVIDLRYPTAGETSGSSLRAMQAAKPLVVSGEGFFLELPEDCCIRLPVGDPESEINALCAALEDLLRHPARRIEMGRAGREFALSSLRIEQAASSYMELVQEVAASSCQPARKWNLGGSEAASGHRLIQWAYQAGRLVYSTRSYGVAGTLRRIGKALRDGHS